MTQVNSNMNAALNDAPTIMAKLQQLEQQNQELRSQIQKQQNLLTSPEFLSRGAPAPAPKAVPKFTKPEEVIDYVASQVMEKMNSVLDQKLDGMLGSLTPLLREATKDAPVWGKTEMARSIVESGEATSMEVALELAEYRMARKASAEAATKAEAEKLAAANRASMASVGASATGGANLGSQTGEKPLAKILDENWAKFGMDEAMNQMNAETDVWGLPAVRGVKVNSD